VSVSRVPADVVLEVAADRNSLPRQLASPAAQTNTSFDRAPAQSTQLGMSLADGLSNLFGQGGGAAGELQGTPDGPPIRLPNGITLQREAFNGHRVTSNEVMQVVQGIYGLPRQHVDAIARTGMPIFLIPTARLEQNRLGATKVERNSDSSPWQAKHVRIAVSAGLPGDESTPEIVQHELGHVVDVLDGRYQGDDAVSEQVAVQYAASH
jgi:hypothetical protein